MNDTFSTSADLLNISAPTPARPEILAPAGDAPSFLAALAAGADAIYLGLKHFSARMQAENFGLTELSRLTDLAHAESARVYVAMNTLVKPDEPAAAYRLISRLTTQARVDGIIVQDLAMVFVLVLIPPLAGQFISLVKDTSLVSVIAITELTKSGREAITTSFSTFEIWFCVAALYLVINLPLSQIASRLERRLAQSD